VDWATITDREEGQQLPSFARAIQNVVVAAALLDTLPEPSANGVGEVYQRLKKIVSTAIVQ
jgi:hypothetical protein